MFNKRAKFRKGIISGFRWLCAFLFLFFSYWWAMTNHVIRDFWDPPYVMKSEGLKARIKEYPGHPLWLVMGSSRVDEGLRPGVLAGDMGSGNAPLIYNFGIGGADLFRELVCLRRVIADGVKPQRVGIEIIGALMSREEEPFADDPQLVVRARSDEIKELLGYSAAPDSARGYWLQSRLNPFYEYGMEVPHQALSLRLLPIPALRRFETHSYDDWGWFAGPSAPVSRSSYDQGLEDARKEYETYLKGTFTVAPNFDQVLRRILDLCRNAGIEVFLLRMPEADDFQAFYPAQANTAIDSYLAKIQGEYEVQMIDARSWMPGWDSFMDGHHLNATGAEVFTRRFAEELLKTAKPQSAP